METVLVPGTDGKSRDIFFLQQGLFEKSLVELGSGVHSVMGLRIHKTAAEIEVSGGHRIGNANGPRQGTSVLAWASDTRLDFKIDEEHAAETLTELLRQRAAKFRSLVPEALDIPQQPVIPTPRNGRRRWKA